MNEREPPHDLAAERAVLGECLLGRPNVIVNVRAVLSGDDWYNQRHAAIWRAIVALHDQGEPVTPVTVADRIDTPQWHRQERDVYLAELYGAAPLTAGAAKRHAGIVRERAIQRQVTEIGARIQQIGSNADPDRLADALTQVREQLTVAETVVTQGRTETGPDWQALIRNGAAFVLDQPRDVPAVWGRGDQVLWASGEALVLCGPQGVGKTTIAGQLLLARLGLRKEVIGYPVTPGNRRVLYLACDRPRQIARSLGRVARPEYRDQFHDRLQVWPGPPPGDFAKDTGLLRQMCEAADADTVFIDSLKDVAIGLVDDTVGAAYNRARQLAITAGVEVIELHHQTKRGGGGTGDPTTLADVYGSVWITSGAGSVLLLWGAAGDPIVNLYHLKQPAEEVGPLRVRHDHQAGTSEVYHQADLVDLAARTRGGLTAKQAAEVLFETKKPTPAQVEKARRHLERLTTDGLLKRTGGTSGGKQGGTPATYHAVSLIDIERAG